MQVQKMLGLKKFGVNKNFGYKKYLKQKFQGKRCGSKKFKSELVLNLSLKFGQN